MPRYLLSAIALVLLIMHSTPSAAECSFDWLCLEKTAKATQNANMQDIISNRKAVLYKPGEIANFNYADIRIECASAGLEKFASQFIDRALNIRLITAGREFALTVDVEQVSKNTTSPPKAITYLIAQVKRDAAGNTTVTGCDDFIATNISFSSPLRLKFKLLQSKATTVNPSTYSAIRIASKVLGFVFAGPSGAAIVSDASDISGAIVANKSDIDEIVKAFDEVNTQKPQVTFDTTEKSVALSLADGSKLTIARVGKRSAFLTFDGDKVNSPGAPLQNPIADATGIDLAGYLTTKAGGWETLIVSTDLSSAKTGCANIRKALGNLFTNEEATVILAKELNQFPETTIRDLKEPCLKGIERGALTKMGIPDPLASRSPDAPATTTPRDPTKDATDPIRWSSIKEFLNEFGRVLSIVATTPNLTKDAKAKRLAAYFDDRVAIESFDTSDLLPSNGGVLRDSLAEKIASWPLGSSIRYGCFLAPDRTLSTKYAAQMLLMLNSDSVSPRLVNLALGFTDPKAADAKDLSIGNLLIEKPTTASLQTFSAAYKSGCGDRADPWKPWEVKVSSVARGRLAESPQRLTVASQQK
jgi:hypothetical protein